MKEKIKRFFIEKKELLIFVGVLLIVFTAVITVATIVLNDTGASGGNITEPNQSENSGSPVPPVNEDENQPQKFCMPVVGDDFVIVRQYFDLDNTIADNALAVMRDQDGKMHESDGISYAKEDKKTDFDVVNVYDGVVEEVIEDELFGTMVVVKHSDEICSVYSSLSEASVEKGQSIKIGEKIGTAGSSLKDPSAGLHVHFQLKQTLQKTYINPINIYGKQIAEVSSLAK